MTVRFIQLVVAQDGKFYALDQDGQVWVRVIKTYNAAPSGAPDQIVSVNLWIPDQAEVQNWEGQVPVVEPVPPLGA